MPKNIVLCFDGLFFDLTSSKHSSNVGRLYRTLVQNHFESQVTYYYPSLGVLGSQRLSGAATRQKRILGLWFGLGVSEELENAYNFLVRTYYEGDKIFLFGVGRGAYTARTLAGSLHLTGLIHPGSEVLTPSDPDSNQA